MKPKILHVSSARLSSGGVERFLLGMCQSLKDTFDFGLLSGADTEFSNRMQELGCVLFPWSVDRSLDFSAAHKLRHAITQFAPDIVHFHDARSRLVSILGSRFRLIKTIYTVHLPPYFYRWEKFDRVRRTMYAFIEQILNVYYMDMVAYPSRQGYEYALQHRYVHEDKAICIPNGIDVDAIIIQRTKQENTIPVICTVARLSPEKNVGFLLEAAALLKSRGCAFRFWVVGDGPERLMLEERAGLLGLSSETRFWGRQEEVAPILHQSDIFTLASLYEGGRAQAVMEAQAAGLPCVLSDVGDNAMMVDAGRGFVFSEGDLRGCADLLEVLLKNQQKRDQMGSTARIFALKEYRLQSMSEQYLRVYHKLLGR